MRFICIAFSRRKTRAKLRRARSGEWPEIQGRGEGAPVVIPTKFTEDVRADFRAQNRLDFRRIVRIGVVMGWPSQSRPLKGSPCDLRGFGSWPRRSSAVPTKLPQNVPRQESVLYPERRLVADVDIFSSIAIERVSQSAQRRCHVHCLSPVSNLRRWSLLRVRSIARCGDV